MIRFILILAFALLGAEINNGEGLVIWGMAAFVALILFEWAVGKILGGMLPRYVRNDTAKDFLRAYPELVDLTYPYLNSNKSKQKKIAHLIDTMFKRAKGTHKFIKVKNASSPELFLVGAIEVAKEQHSEDQQKLALQLIQFITEHPLWYGDH